MPVFVAVVRIAQCTLCSGQWNLEPQEMPGAWKDYYTHWRAMTRQNLDERLLELMPPLQGLVPPAHLCDKAVYSAFGHPRLAGAA